MHLNYVTVDVFTKTLFSGAQIAVFPGIEASGDVQMQKIAAELNLSDTVFIEKRDNGNNHFYLRSFSPSAETGFGSHTTVAAAYALAHSGQLQLTDKHTPLVLEHGGNSLTVHVTHDNGEITLTQMSLSTQPIVDNYVPSREDLAELMSLPVSAFEVKPWRSLLVSNNGIYIVAPVRQLESLRQGQFSMKAWNQSLAPNTSAQQILLFTSQSESQIADFHVALFGPTVGVTQDPPIGAAIPAFGAYLCAHDHIKKGTYSFIAERGWQNTRQSLLHVEMDNKGGEQLTLRVGGTAVVVSEGKMKA